MEAGHTIRKEIAGALGVAESNPVVNETYARLVAEQNDKRDAARLAEAQGIIDDARTYGRRIETPVGPGITKVTELIPGEWTENMGDMTVFMRRGYEVTKGDEKITTMSYFDPGKVEPFASVESVTKNGKEKITKVDEYIKGLVGLKVGDTRDVPPEPVTSAAGKVPSSLDPQPNGKYGAAGGAKSSNGGNVKAEHPPSSTEDRSHPAVTTVGRTAVVKLKAKNLNPQRG